MIKKLQNIDRRIIYIVMFIALALPMFKPVGLPFAIGQPSRDYYNEIENLPADANVVVCFDFGPTGHATFYPQMITTMKHLAEKDVNIAMIAFWDVGAPYIVRAINEVLGPAGLTYGEDYVSFGYLPGQVPAISSFAADIASAIPTDVNGTNTTSIPMMANFKNANDIDLLIDISSGTPGYKEHIQQVVEPYNTRMIASVNGVSVAGLMPYANAGQVKGFLNDLRGCADYEMLTGFLGDGVASQDPISAGHLVLILFILIGNIGYFFGREKEGR